MEVRLLGNIRQRPCRSEKHTVRVDIGGQAGQEGVQKEDGRPGQLLWRHESHHGVQQLRRVHITSDWRQSHEELGPAGSR